jgi:hypothetical protein
MLGSFELQEGIIHFTYGDVNARYAGAYQRVGEFAVVLMIILFARRHLWLAGTSFAVAALCGSRASLVIASFFLICHFGYQYRKKLLNPILLLMLFSIFLIIDLSIIRQWLNVYFPRVGGLLREDSFDLEWGDNNITHRGEYTDFALKTIADHPILGSPFAYVDYYGELGSYAHNVLSVWQDFGIAGLGTFVGFLLIGLHATMRLKDKAPMFAILAAFVSFALFKHYAAIGSYLLVGWAFAYSSDLKRDPSNLNARHQR